MDTLNSFLLGVWLPVLYIVYGVIFRKISIKKFVIFILIVFLLQINWIYIGSIQNVHVTGLSVLAVFLFPPDPRTKKFQVMLGVTLILMLLIKYLFDRDEDMRGYLLFGPNTDSAIILIMLTSLVRNKKNNIMIYLILAAIVISITQSRSAILLIAPIAMILIPRSEKYLFKNEKKFSRDTFRMILYLSIVAVIYFIYTNIELLYALSNLDRESRWNFASYASDLDRVTAFKTAQELAFKNWPSILLGADISPAITGASNVVHSEVFSLLFGGGIVLFLLISTLLMRAVFNIKARFSIIYVVFYLMASGFSTNLLSFPFLFMVSSFLNKVNHSIAK